MNVQNQRSLPHLGGEACFKQIQKVKPLVQVFVGLLAHQNMEFLSAFSDWNFGDISSHTSIVTLFENFGIYLGPSLGFHSTSIDNKPIIISDAANNENLVKDNINGLTFENNNPLELAKKMYQIKNNYIVIDKEERMKFISKHSKIIITEKYVNIFQSIIMK